MIKVVVIFCRCPLERHIVKKIITYNIYTLILSKGIDIKKAKVENINPYLSPFLVDNFVVKIESMPPSADII